jgi:tetratricopeptide (TPR) repeat protein
MKSSFNGVLTRSVLMSLGLVLSSWAAQAGDAPTLLGQIEFPNSGSADAQADFIEGVLYLHNFEYDEAAAAFKRAQEIDPDFAMAYWGEAMTYHHSLWGRQSRDSAEKVLVRLGKTSEARAAKCGTQREKDYLHAAEILFGLTKDTKPLPKPDRDVLYRDEMRRIHETYPDDLEATALYGLSILGASGIRNEATYMRAAAVLTQVWDANRMHPGGAHYLIHSYDDPVHAPLGLPMARAYSKIAPAAAHAQHMTSHIFVALGMWDELVDANERATRIEFGNNEGSMEAGHYVFWLEYGYLQQGRLGEARKLVDAAREKLDANPTSRDKAYYGGLYGRYLFDSGDWNAADALAAPVDAEIPSPHYHFARAYAAILKNDLDTARERAKYLQAGAEGNPEVTLNDAVVGVLHKELEAMIALHDSGTDKAIALLREAVDLTGNAPFRYGPPQVTKPALELLGEVLESAGKTDEAITAFEQQLEQTPRRTNSLLGLARASEARGDLDKVNDAYRRLAEIWHAADAEVDGLDRAREAAQASS